MAKVALNKISKKCNQSMLLLSGGEPTLHSNFEEIKEYCLPLFKTVLVNTNGVTKYFQKVRFSVLRRSNLYFQLSIDGNEAENDRIRGNGTYKKIIDLLKKFREHDIKVLVSTVVNSDNIASIKELCAVLSNLKILGWTVSPLMPFGRALNKKKILTNTQWNYLVDELIDICDFKLNIKKIFNLSQLEHLTDDQLRNISNNASLNCGSGNQKIYIYPDFSVCGCSCINNYKFGNLIQHSLEEIMHSYMAKNIRNYTLVEESYCNKCRYLKICNGGCIGMSLNTFKKIGVGDIRCPLLKTSLIGNEDIK
jgi:radical SAM protein with 4Fe4S-binding SPASM domain